MLARSTFGAGRWLGLCSLVVIFLVLAIPHQAQAEVPLTLEGDTPLEVSALDGTASGGDGLALQRYLRGATQSKALNFAVSQLEKQGQVSLGENFRLRSSLVWSKSLQGELTLSVPVHQGKHNATFLQPSLYLWRGRHEDFQAGKDDNRRDFSLGLVHRRFVDESRSTQVGFASFFDYGSHGHQRLGLGGELRHQQTTLTAQVYLPLTKHRTGFDRRQEITLKGYALGLKQELGGRVSAEANFVRWQVGSSRGAGTSIASDSGNSADLALRYRLNPHLAVLAGYEKHSLLVNAGKSAQFGFEFQLPPVADKNSQSAKTLDLWSPVEREGRILVHRAKAEDNFEGSTADKGVTTASVPPTFVLPPYTSVQLLATDGTLLSERAAIVRPSAQGSKQITFRIVFDKVPHSFAYQLLLEGEAKIPDDYTIAALYLNDLRLPSAEHFVIPASEEETWLDIVFNIIGAEDAPQKRVVLVLRPIHADSIGTTAAVSTLDIAPQAVRAHFLLAAKGKNSNATKVIAFRFSIVEKTQGNSATPIAMAAQQNHILYGKKHNGDSPTGNLPVAVTIKAHAQYLNLGADQTLGGGDDVALKFPDGVQAIETHLRLIASKGTDLQNSFKLLDKFSELNRLQDNCYEMLLQRSQDGYSFSKNFQVAAHQVRRDGEMVTLEIDPFPLQESVESLFANQTTPLLVVAGKSAVHLTLHTPEENAALLEFVPYTREYEHYVIPQEPAQGDAPVILRIPFIISYDQPPAEGFKRDYIVPIHIKKHRGIFGRAEINKDLIALQKTVEVNIVGDGRSGLFTSEFPIELLADDDADEPHELFFVRFGTLPQGFTTHQREKGYFIQPQGISPPAVFLSAPASVEEPTSGTSDIVATLSLLARHPKDIEVPLKIGTKYDSAKRGSDYEDTRRAVITIPAGELSASHSIKVKADDLDEDTEFVTITIAHKPQSRFVVPLDAISSLVVQITDSPTDRHADAP